MGLLRPGCWRIGPGRPLAYGGGKGHHQHRAARRCRGQGGNRAVTCEAIRDPKVYITGVVYFAVLAGTNALVLWIDDHQKAGLTVLVYSNRRAGVYSMGCAVLGMYLIGLNSDRTMERRWHGGVAAAGFARLRATCCFRTLQRACPSSLLLQCQQSGSTAPLRFSWTIPATFLTGSAAAGGIALISSFGAVGGFVSPSIIGWAKTATGNADYGLAAIAAVCVTSHPCCYWPEFPRHPRHADIRRSVIDHDGVTRCVQREASARFSLTAIYSIWLRTNTEDGF